ncbi:helix-turn-helix transcriptional regulator [Paenibacillus piscarius]|uniref:helix-turn-helix transcriptional regulator n=1 Tax=Paenibacillus piscarius TaxID=1089681 RepID=UPI001EE840F8|nr:WYL domain-containing protein [Paenibacillus piscarius]
MSHIHRIQWFDQQIRQLAYPNSSKLAEQFEISRRQAQRDIEYLAESLRAPLRYVAKQRGYIYEDNSFVLPHLYITDEEQRVLKYLAYRYSHYDYENAQSIRKVGGLLERFTEQPLADRELKLPVFEVNPHRLQVMEMLEQAIRARRVLHVLYRHGQDTPQELYLCPLQLSRRVEDDYLVAAVEGDGRSEYYSLSGIRQLTLTGRVFLPGEDGPKAPVEPARPLKPFTARIRMNSVPQDSSWDGYKLRAAEDVYEVDFYEPSAFIAHLLREEWIAILAPKWLKDRLRSICEATLKRLEEQENEQ